MKSWSVQFTFEASPRDRINIHQHVNNYSTLVSNTKSVQHFLTAEEKELWTKTESETYSGTDYVNT